MITDNDLEAIFIQMRELNKNGGIFHASEFIGTLRTLVNMQECAVAKQTLCLHNLHQLLNQISEKLHHPDLKTGKIEYPQSEL